MTEKSEQSVPEVARKLYDLLEHLESADRQKAIAGAMAMLGETQAPPTALGGEPEAVGGSGGSANPGVGGTGQMGVRQFFDSKDPRTKGEELAVAARYRELSEDVHEHTRDDLESAIKTARRDPPTNYTRDMTRAKEIGLFNRGEENKLSAYGQKYVDTLPDRQTAKTIRPPRTSRGGGKKKATSRNKATSKKKAASKKKASSDTG